jgi:hypothetical protein
LNIPSVRSAEVAWRLAAVVALLAAASAVAGEHRAGFAVRDVTPTQLSLDEGRTYLGGYGLWTRRGAAQAVHDPLSARAMCIADAAPPLCMVVVDNLGLPGPVVERIASRAAESGLVTADRVLVSATHTHAAPDLLGLWGGAPREYRERVVEESAAAVVDALESLRPADLHYAIGRASAYNRRGWGNTDDDLVVLQARAADGAPIGTLINFAAHPVVSDGANRAISSDFVHYLRQAFEVDSQAPVVFVNGALGDATPGPRAAPAPEPVDPDYWGPVEQYGVALARAALAIAPHADAGTPGVVTSGVVTSGVVTSGVVTPGIVFARDEVRLPVDNWILSLAQRLGVLDDRIDGPPWNRRVTTSVAYLRLGAEVEAVAVPGEALTRLGLDLKARFDAPARMIFGQTGGSLGYFVPEDEWHTGRNRDYEESVSLGRRTAEAITATAAAIMGTDPGEPGHTTSRGE